MNLYKGLNLSELLEVKKDTIVKCRDAKRLKNKSYVQNLNVQIDEIKEAIRKLELKGEKTKQMVDIEKQRMLAGDEEDRLSEFGFVITHHALKRYQLRFDEFVSMSDLYDRVAKTGIAKHIKVLESGQFPVTKGCVAVIQRKKILTFKDPSKTELDYGV